jgi:hypothetical protein
MLHRLIHSTVVFLAFFFLLFASGDHTFTTSAAPQAAPAKHGLMGNYYISNWDKDVLPPAGPYAQVWRDPNDFSLPKIFSAPVATRVDAQVAFGQGKGFSARNPGPPVIWWPTASALPVGWTDTKNVWNYFAAVIWKGYIHLPKAGTYYFATVSNGASAVYLNQARVALNGNYGGVLVSDAFAYSREQVQDFVEHLYGGRDSVLSQPEPRFQYLVPVSTDAPRDLPIEVRYNPSAKFTHWASEPFGIDLFWMTPDSSRDSNSKLIASIVPSEALYTEAPGPIEKPVVHKANSTISADFLYFPMQTSDQPVTLTIRLADKDGNPVSGKRVYVNSLNQWNPDAIVQPDKPTDEKGETTAGIRANAARPFPHDSTIFATDVTDFVDVTQVAHVTFVNGQNSFFPDTYAPYYDGKVFLVEPLPFRVGQRETFKIPLINHLKNTAEVAVSLKAHGWNIGVGASDWEEVGKSETFKLKPGETREVSVFWTPNRESAHLCFRMDVVGRLLTANWQTDKETGALLTAAVFIVAPAAPGSGQAPLASQQRNLGPVAPSPEEGGRCTFDIPPGPLRPPTKKNIQEFFPEPFTGIEQGCKPNLAQKEYCHSRGSYDQKAANYYCRAALAATDPGQRQFLAGLCQKATDALANFLRCWLDPSNPSYRRLAPAPSDSPAGYVQALTMSMERYEGALDNGDRDWMARQATAMQLYEKRIAESLRYQADELQKKADRLPPDDPSALARQQALDTQLVERLRGGGKLTSDELSLLSNAGLSDQDIKAFVANVREATELPIVSGPRALLFEWVKLCRQSADEADKLAALPFSSGEENKPGQPLIQTYTVANPHDRQETVDLFIRPIAIPADWKLSIVNAEEGQRGEATKAGSNPPKYPVHELDSGKHYNITLPAKAEAQVASVVIPVGEVGARTTARWAVEGKIGNELIGGLVHEMNVPYIIADLKLPPVGSKEVEEELPAPSRLRLYAAIAIAGILIIGTFLFFLFWRKRRAKAAPQG